MDAIILFSHGSVLCGAERNLLDLADMMRRRGDARLVEVAFLNYTEPSLAMAVDRCAQSHATRIIIAPWFLIEGKFVKEDLEHHVNQERSKHPSLQFTVAAVIGAHARLADAVLSSAASASALRPWDETRGEVTPWCRAHPRCPLYGSDGCRVRPEMAP